MKVAFLCLVMCWIGAPRAYAQMTWTDKGFANLTGGFQGGSHTLATHSEFVVFDEPATVDTSQKVKGGGFFDLSAGYKVWRNLAVGIGYSHTGSKANASITGSIPDPVVTDRQRPITASASGLKHSEGAVHITGTWMMPVTDKIDVGFKFGPSIFSVKQDLTTGVTTAEPGPTVSSVTVAKRKKTAGGFHLGIDVTYMLTKRYGVGGLANFTHGSVDLDGATKSLTVGGFQIGAGGRYRF